jgi:hypothetical protein
LCEVRFVRGIERERERESTSQKTREEQAQQRPHFFGRRFSTTSYSDSDSFGSSSVDFRFRFDVCFARFGSRHTYSGDPCLLYTVRQTSMSTRIGFERCRAWSVPTLYRPHLARLCLCSSANTSHESTREGGGRESVGGRGRHATFDKQIEVEQRRRYQTQSGTVALRSDRIQLRCQSPVLSFIGLHTIDRKSNCQLIWYVHCLVDPGTLYLFGACHIDDNKVSAYSNRSVEPTNLSLTFLVQRNHRKQTELHWHFIKKNNRLRLDFTFALSLSLSLSLSLICQRLNFV